MPSTPIPESKPSRDEPYGKVTPIRLVHHRDPNEHVVYVTVVCVDEIGAEWSFGVSCFNHNLQPYVRPKSDTA